MKKIHIRRYNPGGHVTPSHTFAANEMFQDHEGGWIPYTDYCRTVSRLKNKISRLQDTIVKARMKEVGIE